MTKTSDDEKPETHVIYSCPSCPVDMKTPGACDVCGRLLVRKEYPR